MPRVIVAEHVSKRFALHYNRTFSMKERFLGLFHDRLRATAQEFWALRDVSLAIQAGEAVGLVGRNGSGKSTLLKLIAGVYPVTSGRMLVRRNARIASIIQLGVGFHPELTGRENVYMNASIYGLSRGMVDAVYDDIVAYAEIGRFVEEPIKNYSSGMVVRLAFAVVAHLDPDILLLDEIFAVGDADFQEKCKLTMQEFLRRGKTLVFVSHSPDAVRTMCDRVCVLDHGQLVYDGTVDGGLDTYQQVVQTDHQMA